MSNCNFIGVGGLVVRDGEYLMVRHCYGEYCNCWILPGGQVKPGEPLQEAIEREIWEEAAVRTEAQGIIAVRSRSRGPCTTDCYVVFLLKHIEGEPKADGYEVNDARFFSLENLNRMDNVIVLSKTIIQEHANNNLQCLPRNTIHAPYLTNRTDIQLFI